MSPKGEQAFHDMKTALTSPPVLDDPEQDGEFIVNTDVSSARSGAVITQLQREKSE